MFLLISSVFSLSLKSSHITNYTNGDSVYVVANSLSSQKRPIPLDFKISDLFCVSETEKPSNIELKGSRVLTPIVFQIGKETECESVCTKKYTKEQKDLLKKLIDYKYRVFLEIDDLPVSFHVFAENRTSFHIPGFDIGYVGDNGKYYLNNYIEFIVEIERFIGNTTKIVGFEAYSVNSKSKPDCESLTTISIDDMESTDFQYTIRYSTSKTIWEHRWDRYSTTSGARSRIQVFSVINTVVIVLVQSVVVGAILLRTIKFDFLRYSRILDDDEDPLEETGWKLVHGDVFRRPEKIQTLSTVFGGGFQLFVTAGLVTLCAALGFVDVSEEGSIKSFSVKVFIATSIISGFVSGIMFHTIGTKKWRSNMLTTALCVLLPTAVSVFLLQIVFRSTKSTMAVSTKSMLHILLAYCGPSLLLSIIGSFIALRLKPIEFPARVNQLPRQIPLQPNYLKSRVTQFIGGTVVFLSFGIQMRIILNSFWTHSSYYFSYTLLFVTFAAMILTSCEISVLFVYLHLMHEDYNWWWPAFKIPASSGVAAFIFSLIYLFVEYKPIGFVSYIIFVLVSLCVSYGIALINGSIGFFTSLMFVMKIFSELKIE